MKDYYKTLGVPRNADDGVIKKAYRALAREFHPDRHQDPVSQRYQSTGGLCKGT